MVCKKIAAARVAVSRQFVPSSVASPHTPRTHVCTNLLESPKPQPHVRSVRNVLMGNKATSWRLTHQFWFVMGGYQRLRDPWPRESQWERGLCPWACQAWTRCRTGGEHGGADNGGDVGGMVIVVVVVMLVVVQRSTTSFLGATRCVVTSLGPTKAPSASTIRACELAQAFQGCVRVTNDHGGVLVVSGFVFSGF